MEEFGWLPQEIDSIPYKRLQEIMLIRNSKNIATQSKANVEKWKAEQKVNRGGKRSFTRNV